jgi:hypothetical protein
VLYYADSVFADQTEQYPAICESLTRSREYVLLSFMLLYVFFGVFLFFMHQISTARGMDVSDNGKRNEGNEGDQKEMPIVGNM